MALATSSKPFGISNSLNRLSLRKPKIKSLKSGLIAPRVDIKELKNHYEITAELPGVSKDNVHITVDDGLLAITAETRQEKATDPEGRLIRQERRSGKLVRSFLLGDRLLQTSDIDTVFSDGLLTLNIPRTTESAPPEKSH